MNTKNQVEFETGATSHAINDLILFTDNTRSLALVRDRIYSMQAKASGTDLAEQFQTLLTLAVEEYKNEFPDSYKHIATIDIQQMEEYCKLYAEGFRDWENEHV